MTLNEIQTALRRLRVSGMAATLEGRLREAQAGKWPPIDLIGVLVQDELVRRQDRLVERRIGKAGFRDGGKTLDSFDLDFNRKMDRRLILELHSAAFVQRREDVLMLGPPGTGKSHLAQSIGHAAARQGYVVRYREAHALCDELAEASLVGQRRERLDELSSVALLIIDDLGMRKLPATAAEDLLELVMRRYERHSTILTSNRPVDDWGRLLGDNAAVSAMLDRLLHHGHVLKCGPRSYRTKAHGLSEAQQSV